VLEITWHMDRCEYVPNLRLTEKMCRVKEVVYVRASSCGETVMAVKVGLA
jgi:hypothetical protein